MLGRALILWVEPKPSRRVTVTLTEEAYKIVKQRQDELIKLKVKRPSFSKALNQIILEYRHLKDRVEELEKWVETLMSERKEDDEPRCFKCKHAEHLTSGGLLLTRCKLKDEIICDRQYITDEVCRHCECASCKLFEPIEQEEV